MMNKKILIFIQSFLLVVVISVGVFARFYRLDKESFWFDEIFSVKIASVRMGNLISTVRKLDPANPPLYFSVLSLYLNIVGGKDIANEAISRSLSAIFGSLNIFLFFFLSRKLLKNNFQSLFSTSLFSLSVFLIQYSRNARAYPLQTLLVILLYFLLFKILEEKNKISLYIFFTVCGILAVYTHYTSILFLLIVLASFLFLKGIQKQVDIPSGKIFISFSLVSIFFYPWFFYSPLKTLTSPKIIKNYGLLGSGGSFIVFFRLINQFFNNFFSTLHFNEVLFLFLWFFGLLLSIWKLFEECKKVDHQEENLKNVFLLFLGLQILIISILLVFSPLKRIISNYYYYHFMTVPLFIFFGYFFSFLYRLKWLFLGLWIFFSFKEVNYFLKNPYIDQYREVAQYLSYKVTPESKIYVPECDVNYVLYYYFNRWGKNYNGSCNFDDFSSLDNVDFFIKRVWFTPNAEQANVLGEESFINFKKNEFYGLDVYQRRSY